MKILTVGGAMIDTIAIIDSDRIERMTILNADSSFLLPEEGRKTEAEEVSTHPGGGGVNAAVAMARLGMDVALLAKLGNDARADAILARLTEEGASSRWKSRPLCPDLDRPGKPRCHRRRLPCDRPRMIGQESRHSRRELQSLARNKVSTLRVRLRQKALASSLSSDSRA